jgi:hypothetical protein
LINLNAAGVIKHIKNSLKLQNVMLKVVFPQDATNEICSKPTLVYKTDLRKNIETVYDEAIKHERWVCRSQTMAHIECFHQS